MSTIDSLPTDVSLSRKTLYDIGVYVVMYGLAALFFIPLLRMFTLSVTPATALFGFHWIPENITFSYWNNLITTNDLLWRWVLNTILVASATTILVVVVDSLIAFSLTRLEWTGRKVILGIVLASFMVPPQVNVIPLFTLVNRFNLINSYWAVVLPLAAAPLGVFLLVQFFRDLPEELEEAARMDGFSTFRIYAQIIVPLSLSIITALALFTFVWSWNQYLWPLIVLTNEQTYTLPIGATTLKTVYSSNPGRLMASLAIISLPLFIVFLLFQDRLISSVQMQVSTG